MRNRIISGLSDGILVIEAGKKSGSLITAELGLDQGKEVFVVPGDIYNPCYIGSNQLIQSGAALVTKTRDILDGLGIFMDEDASVRKKNVRLCLKRLKNSVFLFRFRADSYIGACPDIRIIGTTDSESVAIYGTQRGSQTGGKPVLCNSAVSILREDTAV